MSKQSELIGQLSGQSKKSLRQKSANNPLVRKNKQLEDENERLIEENEFLKSEIASLKLSLASVVEGDISKKADTNDLNLRIKSLENLILEKEAVISDLRKSEKSKENAEKIISLKAEIVEKDKIISNFKSESNNSSIESPIEFFLNLDLSANAQKFLLAISSLCLTKGDWFHISGRSIKRDFNVHDNYFTDSREELVKKGLIEVKEEKRGKQPLWKYKRLF